MKIVVEKFKSLFDEKKWYEVTSSLTYSTCVVINSVFSLFVKKK
jgi:hypothetical protein